MYRGRDRYVYRYMYMYTYTCMLLFVWKLMIQRAFWPVNQLPGAPEAKALLQRL